MKTTSWINIVLSIEKVFRDLLPDMPVYRFELPGEIGEQRALIEDHALFLQLVSGEVQRFQDTYCTLWLCEIVSPQKKYTPEQNYKAVWLQEQMMVLQKALDDGQAQHSHLFPLYDYQGRLSRSAYNAFLSSGDTSSFDTLFASTPPLLTYSGFVVRAGSNRPELTVMQNPMYMEWTVVFQHCNPEVYQGMRG